MQRTLTAQYECCYSSQLAKLEFLNEGGKYFKLGIPFYTIFTIAQVLASERIERKFKTENPNPKYEGFFPGVVKVQGHGVFQIG